jgi:hypothetical protein
VGSRLEVMEEVRLVMVVAGSTWSICKIVLNHCHPFNDTVGVLNEHPEQLR